MCAGCVRKRDGGNNLTPDPSPKGEGRRHKKHAKSACGGALRRLPCVTDGVIGVELREGDQAVRIVMMNMAKNGAWLDMFRR
jgi:hypothetical protein